MGKVRWSVVAWDKLSANEDTPAQIAMSHDLMRGIKGGNSVFADGTDSKCDQLALLQCPEASWCDALVELSGSWPTGQTL